MGPKLSSCSSSIPPGAHGCRATRLPTGSPQGGTHLGLVALIGELGVALLDEDVPDVDEALEAGVPVHVHMQDAVHDGEDLHEQRAAAQQAGKPPTGPATPALATHQGPGGRAHSANLEFQRLWTEVQGEPAHNE